jgi:hypothetical protein
MPMRPAIAAAMPYRTVYRKSLASAHMPVGSNELLLSYAYLEYVIEKAEQPGYHFYYLGIRKWGDRQDPAS